MDPNPYPYLDAHNKKNREKMKEFLHVPIFLSTGSFFENKILKELFKEKIIF